MVYNAKCWLVEVGSYTCEDIQNSDAGCWLCADGYFPFGAKICIVWATMDVLMCTSSIWHMATISVDRYCSMRFPLRYRRTRTPVFVIAKIAFVWIVSIGICSPLAIAGFVNALNVYRGGRCAPGVPQFVIYGSIFAFFVPLVLMVVTYALTVKTLTRTAIWRRQERQRSSQYGDANAPHGDGSIIRASSLIHSSFNAEKNQSVKCPLTPIQSDGECPRSHASTTAVDRASQDHVTEKKSAVKKPQMKETDGHKAQSMSGMIPTSRNDTADVRIVTRFTRQCRVHH